MASRWIRLIAATGLLAGALSLPGVASAAGPEVTISGLAFSPATLTVTVGDTVTWTNRDPVGHTVTGTGFDTGTIAGGASASVTFANAGTFAYVCTIHQSMAGTVVVKASGGGVTHGDGVLTAPPTDAVPAAGPAQPAGPGTWALALLALAGIAGLGLASRRMALARVAQRKR